MKLITFARNFHSFYHIVPELLDKIKYFFPLGIWLNFQNYTYSPFAVYYKFLQTTWPTLKKKLSHFKNIFCALLLNIIK